MKKIQSIIFIVLILTLSFFISCSKKSESEKKDAKILDTNGNFGGTLNKELYGEGAPCNGKLDHDSIYYTKNDYFNLESTETRSILNNFSTYQQTMENSDGIACVLMALNYYNEDTTNTYNELELTKKYEDLNGTNVYENSTNSDGLKKLIESCGYKTSSYEERGATNSRKQKKLEDFIIETVSAGKIMLVRYQDGMKNRWHVIVGIDTMGTTIEGVQRDDVIIFADPFDAYDHYQDGYSISSLNRFWKWWREVDEKGDEIAFRENIIIEPKQTFSVKKSETDPIKQNKQVPDRHLLLNIDGSFGGTYNKDLYGTISEKNGYYEEEVQSKHIEHTEYNYYAYPDYYNLDDEGSRLLLHNYQAYEQTMASSCGMCSLLSVLNYYHYDFSNIIDFIDEKNFGSIDNNDNAKKQEAILKVYMQGDENCTQFVSYGGVGVKTLNNVVETLGFSGNFGRYYKDDFTSKEESMCFDTYDKFLTFVTDKLSKDIPIIICWCPISGHFEVIIGIDTCGTEEIYDDVIILADSHDTSDHYQDGYNTYPAELFFSQWYNSSCTVNQAYLYFENK